MFKFFCKIFLPAIIFISGCKTNPPTEVIVITDYGKVFVSSNVTGAEIFLDNVSTSKFTPDTIIATTGNHTITLKKSNYAQTSLSVGIIKDSTINLNFTLQPAVNKIVLVEDFANVSCVPCVTSNLILEAVKKNYSDAQIAVIKYPTNFPSPIDPFYLANTPASSSKISFYNVFSAPSTRIDGMMKPISSDSVAVKDSINKRLTTTPKFILELDDTTIANTLSFTILATIIDTAGVDLSKLVLNAVLTETYIEYSTPPGSNGETKFYNIMREIIPSPSGTSLASIAINVPSSFNFSTTINPSWNKSYLKLIVYVQNTSTKEVYQTITN